MPLCAVITCKYATEGHDGDEEGIEFHPFPKCKETKARWLEMTGQGIWDPENTPNFVCSRHFRESDYTVKRSGRKYLKTSAIPCEYVVYPLSIFHDEESDEENIKPRPAPVQQADRDEPNEPGFLFDAEPGPIQGLPMRPPGSQEPDSTFIDENTISEPWERFLPSDYFGKQTSSEVGSSSEYDFRDVGSAINPYPPVDLGPHLQQLPLPRTPEPFMLEEESQDSIDAVPPQVAYQRSKAKLDRIRKIASKRNSSKKLKTASLAVVEEAKSLKVKMQTGLMNDHDTATAVIALQNKQIAKLEVLYKRLRKKIKKISAVLREND